MPSTRIFLKTRFTISKHVLKTISTAPIKKRPMFPWTARKIDSPVIPLFGGITGIAMFYGRLFRPERRVFAKLYPFAASQLIDQSIAPRMLGQVCPGLNDPQLEPLARQFNAATTVLGSV